VIRPAAVAVALALVGGLVADATAGPAHPPAVATTPRTPAPTAVQAAVPPGGPTACAPDDGRLGTARVLPVATAGGLFVGTKSYPETLPLADHEVVLTFDDGPAGATTDAVLAALARQCVRATFFVVGEMVRARPAQLRRIVADGHTVGTHSMTHPVLARLPTAAAEAEIAAGRRTVDAALAAVPGTPAAAPFFRYPGFAGTPDLDRGLATAGLGVFGADFWGSDWQITDPDRLLATVLERLRARGRGILLLHDTKPATAAMLPRLLDALRDGGYRVVHIVPAR
jgi:peptidoglycan/xylan/chitin deacetylase (PgdA/CDA1 family)